MSDPNKRKVLLEWCAENSIFIDAQIYIGSGHAQEGFGVFSGDVFIPPRTTLVKIPKDAVLSTRTSSIASLLPYHPYGLDAQLSLTLALYVEISKARRSRWYGYLQSLPSGIVDLPLFWSLDTKFHDDVDGSEALTWLRGTEAGKIISTKTENKLTKLEEVTRFYYGVAEPLLKNADVWQQDATTRTPGLLDFYRSFSLVSSRAFLVDAFHGLSMVPIADAFNHIIEHQIHLESDYDVCPECGSLYECPHDREEVTSAAESPFKAVGFPYHIDDQFLEMVSNAGIPPRAEIFNTYGEVLSNAQLLDQYGFILDVNHNDRLKWTMEEIVDILSLDDSAQLDFETLHTEIHGVLPCLSGEALSHSQLVYHEPSTENFFCLNDEGSLSRQLWALLFAFSIRRYRNLSSPSDHDIPTLVSAVWGLQTCLEDVVDNDEDKEVDIMAQGVPEPDALAQSMLLWMSNSAVKLCTARKQGSGKDGSYALESLSDIMDDIPTEHVRTHLAISQLMAERSILDCCEGAWTALLSSGAHLLHSKE